MLNGLKLFAVDVANNEDEAKEGVVFVNKVEPVCPNIAVLVDAVNGLELATGVLLNELLNSGGLVTGLGAKRLLVENGFEVGWLNGLFGRVFNDGKGVPEEFGPPESPNMNNVTHFTRTCYMDQTNLVIILKEQINKGCIQYKHVL